MANVAMPNTRPGDWVCPACSNLNYANRMVCNRCGSAKQGAHGMAGGVGMPGAMPGYGKASAFSLPPQNQRAAPYGGRAKGSATPASAMKPGDWCCPLCFNHNFADKFACNRCHAPKNPMMHGQAGAFGKGTAGANGGGDVRPGDWVCHACKNNNYANREVCNKCGIPKSTFISKTGLRPGDWICPQCQNHNWADKANCQKCQAPRTAQSIQAAAEKGGDWVCHACKNVNYASREVCNRCQIPRTTFISKTGLRAGDWICPQCQNHNWADKGVCGKCSTPRSLDSVSTKGMKPGDWLCTFCSNHNFADKARCNRCQSAKQVSVVTMSA